MVKSLPAIQETRVRSLGQEDSLEKEMATHSSIFFLFFFFENNSKRSNTSVFLPGKSHGWRSLAGYSPWGHKET